MAPTISKMLSPEMPSLKGGTLSGLWHVPLQENETNLNIDTILLNKTAPSNGINNVCELTSMAKQIQYLCAACCFLTQTTWLAMI